MKEEKEAKDIAEERKIFSKKQNLNSKNRVTLRDIDNRIKNGSYNEINIIIKGDKYGSIQALADSLLQLSNDKVKINIINMSVGQISYSDIDIASYSKSIITCFYQKISKEIQKLANEKNIIIKNFDIIYEAIDYVKEIIDDLSKKEKILQYVGKAKVIALFKKSNVGTIAGCLVIEGPIHVKDNVKILRDNNVIFEGVINSLKHFNGTIEGVSCL